MIRVVPKGTVLTLLVEANGLVRFQLTRALERAGYEVIWAATVEEAAQTAARYPIDLLVMDVDQPLQQGRDVFQRLSAINGSMSIVILTRPETELGQAVVQRVGALLLKPVDVPLLIHTISVLLGRRPKSIGRMPPANVSARPIQPELERNVAHRRALVGA